MSRQQLIFKCAWHVRQGITRKTRNSQTCSPVNKERGGENHATRSGETGIQAPRLPSPLRHPPRPRPISPPGEAHLPSGGDPSGGSGVQAVAHSRPCRTHPLPTSSMGEAPLLGSVQPRSAARNFAIYEQGGRVPLALAASVLDPCQSWGGQGGPKLVDLGGGGDPPAKVVPSGVSGPAGSSPLRLRRCPGEKSRQPRAPLPPRRGSPGYARLAS